MKELIFVTICKIKIFKITLQLRTSVGCSSDNEKIAMTIYTSSTNPASISQKEQLLCSSYNF